MPGIGGCISETLADHAILALQAYKRKALTEAELSLERSKTPAFPSFYTDNSHNARLAYLELFAVPNSEDICDFCLAESVKIWVPGPNGTFYKKSKENWVQGRDGTFSLEKDKSRLYSPKEIRDNFLEQVKCVQHRVQDFTTPGFDVFLKLLARSPIFDEEERLEMIFWLREREFEIPTKIRTEHDNEGHAVRQTYRVEEEPSKSQYLVVSAIYGTN
ncbi:hypothetical protein GALMADRAFT_213517 [Galerina marginata CBS 339.88]|uniref:Uncharacterized protein n=1 Tax=Galerina marginata (strain CBS 339.88) TaxID=685588 RepID=A0A067SWL2_GALM3|nr:hypothetical protein GALMADRAFT_213517 [Galerina marginata CBS 339.88]